MRCKDAGRGDEYFSIECHDVTKRFRDSIAVDHLSLKIPAGSIFGLMGPNGAGKSTAIKMLCGILAADSGDILLFGRPLADNPIEAKRNLGVVPDGLALFEQLSLWEHLDLVRSLYGIEPATFHIRATELLELFSLIHDAEKLVRQASYGMRKKLALSMALLPNPKVLLLDEPFEGLDPIMALVVKRALRQAAKKGITIFVTTHVLECVEDLISHYGFLRQGRLIAQGDASFLRSEGNSLLSEYLKYFGDTPNGELNWLG